MRLGAPVEGFAGPDEWVDLHRRAGYRAAYWPDTAVADRSRYVAAAEKADLVIAELGAWSNPLAADDRVRRQALETCRARLALADEVGARCCVNIAGSLGPVWDGPAAANFSDEAFGLVVESVRSIIDAVKPVRTFYALELMPWIWPWDGETYLQLIRAIDRPRFGVHLDPANTMSSPWSYFHSAQVYGELFRMLGPWIKSCHVKDLQILPGFPVRIGEVPPTEGGLDLAEYFRLAQALDPELPLMLEHLPDAAAYARATARLRETGLFIPEASGA